MSTTFNMIFRGEDHEIEGYYETGDPSVGLFGGGFIAEKITRISDGYVLSEEEIEALTDAEQELVHSAYGDWYNEKYPEPVDDLDNTELEDWYDTSRELDQP
jgi:hypothetical protein